MAEPDAGDLARRALDAGLLSAEHLLDDRPTAPRKYALQRELGRGGAGVVWLAQDRELQRPVALKFLHDDRASVLERFRREARFTARLENPSIVQVYELGAHEGHHYLAMQYVDGQNLEQITLSGDELVALSIEIAQALQHAHDHGIVHRDIKPSNVLLDRQRRPYLTDFGIAHDVMRAPGATLSQEGMIIGTPAAMAPEQARGELHAVDARTDVYALGALMYFKLTGRWPFVGGNVVDVLHAVMHEPPPFPRRYQPELPRALEAIVLRCLAKDREARFPSMSALIEELERHRQGSSVVAGAWFRKLVGVAPEQSPTTPSPSDPYWTLGLEVARDVSAFDAERYRISRNLPRLYPRLQECHDKLRRYLKAHPDAAWARFWCGVTKFRLGELDEATEHMERSIDQVETLPSAWTELGKLYLALHLRDQREARQHFSEYGGRDTLARSLGRLEQATLALREASRREADVPRWQQRFPDALSRLAGGDVPGCIALCREVLEEDPDAEDVWRLKGDAERMAKEEPFESYRRALEIRRSDHETRLILARALLAAGREDDARREARRALEVLPEWCEARALLLRIELARLDEGADPAVWDQAREAIRTLREEHPRHAETRFLSIEAHRRRAERDRDEASITDALEDVAAARDLPICQNRVDWCEAQLRLLRARIRRAKGGDPREDLEHVLSFRSHPFSKVSDNGPWIELIREAESLAGG